MKVSVLPEGTGDDEGLRVSFAEDLARETLDATEKSIAVLNLWDELGKPQEEIGDLLEVGKAHLRRAVDLLAAPEDVREALRRDGSLSGTSRRSPGSRTRPRGRR